MPIDLPKLRAWSRKAHQYDDAALALSWEAAKAELEARTGWVLDPVVREQYVAEMPADQWVRIERQPVTMVNRPDDVLAEVALVLQKRNGITYAKLDVSENYRFPVVLEVSCGTNTLDPLLEMALMQRTIEIEASRGDDTQALPGPYWDRICKMIGKGIG